jgi:DNA-binding winged helix-turn-helix (wHTH) protein
MEPSMRGVYSFDRYELRSAERQLLIEGEPAALGARAFDLLLALIERRDRVVTKAELFDAVWPGLVVEENNLQVQVSSLRKLLGPNAIATVAGRGYQFVARLDDEAARSSPASEIRGHPSNLSQARTRFIGREAALAATGTSRGSRIAVSDWRGRRLILPAEVPIPSIDAAL